jgi:hypothetical protein
MAEEKVEAAKAEVRRLLNACFIREVTYTEWLSSVIMVKKKNGKWRMCTDFTDLNKCCPKDDFPLSRIDQIIDSTAASEMMALLDCFSGYRKIWLCAEDEEKTNFITSFGTYCYLRMPEGLRNVGPTFCRMMKAVLKDQVDRNVLSYVVDIVVASNKKENYISDLAETFVNMREARLRLNPEKCVFEITRGKILVCLVSTKGIEANPDKIRTITQMRPPQNRKNMQKLTGWIASLNRFISKLVEHSLPFFSILRRSTKVEWGAEQQKAFDDLKSYLKKLPALSSPEQGQPLILYVSATHSTVSGALVVEKEIVGNVKIVKQQFPVYFVSNVLTGSKRFYSKVEKIYYAVIMSARKLWHYFGVHTIRVLIDQSLHDIFRNRDNSRRISKWAMELSEYVVDFEKRSAIKSQVLTEFVAEWTELSSAT